VNADRDINCFVLAWSLTAFSTLNNASALFMAVFLVCTLLVLALMEDM
jgi:hypothetical protein